MLPKIQRIKMPDNVFPTLWQTVIFRNYRLVDPLTLAETLSCTEEILHREAERLGLVRGNYNPDWVKKGYITLIRNNWFLLPYAQLIKLLGVDENRFDFILQNDDFLSVKLGGYKPECAPIYYSPLTESQTKETERIALEVRKYIQSPAVEPFDFFPGKRMGLNQFAYSQVGRRIVHGYLSPCGDVFMEDSKEYMPDELLGEYAACGVNGIWLHALLSALSPYPFDETLSKDYDIRRRNLQFLIERCARFGIKVYLYFNEPRALPQNKIGKYAHLIGRSENGCASLCFEHSETQDYLYTAVKDLLCSVVGLGGIITITMSENPTHCNYRPNTNCPICRDIAPECSAAMVNNVFAKAVRDSGSGAELIANLWGWSPFMEWSEEQTLRGVELLDRDISVMCVSEYDLEIEKGGVQSRIIDYSISNPGPSEITRKTLNRAGEFGHKLYAKIQTNNSWECSAVPYLPVFDLYYEHLQKLSKIGVKDYMLTWTLGGFPSPMLSMAASYAQELENFSLDEWYRVEFGADFEKIRVAVGHFCKGFQEYPFSIDTLYFSPKTLGCANAWSLEAQDKLSTMVCYAFDDYENWTKPYPLEVYLSQYEKLLDSWRRGCDLLKDLTVSKGLELKLFAEGAYSHFLSDYLQTKFSFLKKDIANNKEIIRKLIGQEKKNVKQLLDLVYANACVGFEASNHYFYTDRNLIEKILLLNILYEKMGKIL